MPVDKRARHLLYRKLEAVLGPEEAEDAMDHLPPAGFANLNIEQSARRIVMWTSSMVLASAVVAFAAGRFV
jgi:hypothetical protein